VAPSRKKNYPVTAAETLRQLLHNLGVDYILKRHAIWSRWEEIVGEKIASHTHPDFISGKSLFIIVDHPTWMHQLNFLKEQLLVKINEVLGTQPVSDIRFRLGVLPARKKAVPRKGKSPRKISRSEERQIEASLGPIAAPELREVLHRVMCRDFMAKKARQDSSS
jgi:predicted nucleic acid-binding Zn ribbon protein